MSDDAQHELGPLAPLAGVWEGEKGTDTAPDDDRVSKEINRYRERMSFEPTGVVENHDQRLFGLRYATTAWRLGEQDPFRRLKSARTPSGSARTPSWIVSSRRCATS
jgi:hypothetical protein